MVGTETQATASPTGSSPKDLRQCVNPRARPIPSPNPNSSRRALFYLGKKKRHPVGVAVQLCSVIWSFP